MNVSLSNGKHKCRVLFRVGPVENVCTKALKALAGSLQIRMWHLFHAWPARSARWAQDFSLCMLAQIRTSGWPQRVHAVR